MKEKLELLFSWRGVEIKYIPKEKNGFKDNICLNCTFALVDGKPIPIVGFNFDFLAFNELEVRPIIELSPKMYEKYKHLIADIEKREWVVWKTNPQGYIKKV